LGKRDEFQTSEKKDGMRRNLKIYWLNCAVVLSVIAGSAVWQARGVDQESTLEPPAASPDGRYHWAEVGRDVLIVIRDGEYEEIVTPPPGGLDEVASSGFAYRSGDNLILSDLDTGTKRNFQIAWDGIFEANAQTGEHRLFERCKHASARVSLGENPYSVDGVKLGMTVAEVEGLWGPVLQDRDSKHDYSRQGDPEASISLDAEGRVDRVRGRSLFENDKRIFAEDTSFEESRNVGHEEPFYDLCGMEYVLKSDSRTLDDYLVEFQAYNLRELERELGADYLEFARQNNLEGVISVQLTYR